jgi:hypothetical protein
MRREPRTPIIILLLVSALVTAYGGCYCFLVNWGIDVRNGYDAVKIPCYWHGGLASEILFWPAHQIDRGARPDVWGESSAEVQLTRSEFRKLLATRKS